MLEANCQTCVKRPLYRSLKSGRFGQMVFLQKTCEGLLPMVLPGKMFFYISYPLYRVICIKSSPLEVFYYKGFLQICSKFIGEHPHENVTSETQLNGQVLLLKGDFLFYPYITSSTKIFLWLQENATKQVELNINEQVELNIAKEN